ncbi:MAG TPA: hypothetical protein DIT89_16215, partial [Planctomycetaceae bacterium]|nr:hypothetical protein [Planctomycetaceae bacterium]
MVRRTSQPQTSTARRQALSAAVGLAASGVAGFCSQLGAVQAAVPAASVASAKSVILIFNCGAPSHLDLWDMKPLAAA